jgi:uncharacterized protein YjbI with pentapeptide repeats
MDAPGPRSTTPIRRPRAPQLTRELQTPPVTRDVFVDEARHDGLLLQDTRHTDVEADSVELKEFVLTEVDLSGAKLDGLDLEDGSLKACNLANLRSRGCTLDRVEIETSRLTGAMLVEPRLMDVLFRDCPIDLSSFRFGRLSRVRFERCRLSEADFQGVTARACSFIDCDMTGVQLSQGTFTGSAFRGCSLSGARGLEALRGTQMAFEDVLDLAAAVASTLGIEIRDDIF